jgi:hypothetical protein
LAHWQDVKSIDLQKVGGDTMVIVTLGNTPKYKEQLSSLLWKMAYQESTQELCIMYSSSTIDLEPRSYTNFLYPIGKEQK